MSDSHPSGPNAGTSDPTDGRAPLSWKTRYPSDARWEIRGEAAFLFLLLGLSLITMFLTWNGFTSAKLGIVESHIPSFKRYVYYGLSGMFGCVVFGMKYFYRVVARGFWHQDRRYWRIMSPFIAMSLSLAIGTVIDAGFLTIDKPITNSAVIAIGFLSGYFADEMVGKMYEVAGVIFGPAARKDGDETR